ncbi:MAG: hypothetical protein GXO09_06385 [Crenarchaeota archaeon]|nr:hypothetical protein [Thermoproteota archaeon]
MRGSTLLVIALVLLASTPLALAAFAGVLWRVATRLYYEGYDTVHAAYLVESARLFMRRGDYPDALARLVEAAAELASPRSRGVLNSSYSIVGFYNDTRLPPPGAIAPVGVTYTLSRRGYLVYPNDSRWRLSCFIIVFAGRGSGGWMAYQGRLPFTPWEHAFMPRVYVNGSWRLLRIVFAGPIYARRLRGGVMVYEYSLDGRYVEYVFYDGRIIIHGVRRVGDGRPILLLRGRVVDVFWMGNWTSYILHGVYVNRRGFDAWSGFWLIANATLYYMGRIYRGLMVFDRAIHRSVGCSAAGAGQPIVFSCMVIYSPNGPCIALADAYNPSPAKPPAAMEHQLLIHIPGRAPLVTSSFNLTWLGSLQPRGFRLAVRAGDVVVDASTTRVSYWPGRWPRWRGTWWSGRAVYSWGRCFTLWRINITVDGVSRVYTGLGVGEYTGYSG